MQKVLKQDIGRGLMHLYIQHVDTSKRMASMGKMSRVDMYRQVVGRFMYGAWIRDAFVYLFISAENTDVVEYCMRAPKDFLFKDTNPDRSKTEDNVTLRVIQSFGNVSLEYKTDTAECLGVAFPYEFWKEVDYLVLHGVMQNNSIAGELVYNPTEETNKVTNAVGDEQSTSWIQIQDLDEENCLHLPDASATYSDESRHYAVGTDGHRVYMFISRKDVDRRQHIYIAAAFDKDTIHGGGDDLIQIEYKEELRVSIVASGYEWSIPSAVWDAARDAANGELRVDEGLCGFFWRKEDKSDTRHQRRYADRAREATGLSRMQMLRLKEEYPKAYDVMMTGGYIEDVLPIVEDIKSRYTADGCS